MQQVMIVSRYECGVITLHERNNTDMTSPSESATAVGIGKENDRSIDTEDSACVQPPRTYDGDRVL